jgi:hypothetical protein
MDVDLIWILRRELCSRLTSQKLCPETICNASKNEMWNCQITVSQINYGKRAATTNLPVKLSPNHTLHIQDGTNI